MQFSGRQAETFANGQIHNVDYLKCECCAHEQPRYSSITPIEKIPCMKCGKSAA